MKSLLRGVHAADFSGGGSLTVITGMAKLLLFRGPTFQQSGSQLSQPETRKYPSEIPRACMVGSP